MQTIWTRLADQLVRYRIFISVPVVLDLQPPQLLCSGQSRLESIYPPIEVVLGLVEDLLGLEDLEESLLTIEDFFCEEEVGQLLDGDLGSVSLGLDELTALRS